MTCLAWTLPALVLGQSPYAGNYAGTYSGDESGSWKAVIDSAGNGTGYGIGPGGRAEGSGYVTEAGGLTFTFGSVETGATFSGVVDGSGNVAGTWENSYYGMHGSFSGKRTTSGATAPKVSITSPKANSRLTEESVTVTVTASSSVGVAKVEGGVSNAWTSELSWESMSPLESGGWEGDFVLAPGQNMILVRATDTIGTQSLVATRKVTYVVYYTVSLTIDPPEGGTVTGIKNGDRLEAGKPITAKATPKSGYLFSYWSYGDTTTNTASLKLLMPAEDLSLSAVFAVNPFPDFAGTYVGLCRCAEDWTNSGLLNLVLTDKGLASGKVMSGGSSYSFTGIQFNPQTLAATFQVKRGTRLPALLVTVALQGDLSQPCLSGSVAAEDWSAECFAPRRPTSSIDAGKYTLALRAAGVVSGIGAGTIIVDKLGAVKLTGNLGDGTALTLSSQIGVDGSWPIYVSLYGGKGVLLGWGAFENGKPVATLCWMKPPRPTDKYYPAGFSTDGLELDGARYTPPRTGQSVITDWTEGSIELGGGNLADPVNNAIVLNKNKVTVIQNSAGISLTITTASGLFSGSFVDPQTQKKRSLKGAILQEDGSYGVGWFLGTNESGYVWFGQ